VPSRLLRGIRIIGDDMGSFRGFLFAGAMTAAVALCAPAFAESDAKVELATKQAQNAALAKKTKALGAEVDTLKSRIVTTARTLRDSEDSLAETRKNLEALQAEKAQCLKDFYAGQAALGGLVTAAQRYNRSSAPELIMQAEPVDAARASLVMKSMIPVLFERSALLKQKAGEMENIETRISAELAAQAQQHKVLAQQQADLGRLLAERQSNYQKTESSRKQLASAVEKLAKEASNLEDLVDKIKPEAKSESLTALPSSLPLPVSGAIRTGFGEKDDFGSRSKGITFSAPAGATVVTPMGGTVKFAGNFQKYKQILIVEHAGGYHSLIAGLGRIDTVVGATLAAGEPVGIAEKAGDDLRIYYELRQNGEPVNPRKLLLAQKKQAKS
jgi:murein hydrolase activator